MDFRISGLPVEPFIPFFSMSDEELLTYGACRVIARPEDAPLEPVIDRMFARDDVAFLHAHNAKRGCYSCRIDRV